MSSRLWVRRALTPFAHQFQLLGTLQGSRAEGPLCCVSLSVPTPHVWMCTPRPFLPLPRCFQWRTEGPGRRRRLLACAIWPFLEVASHKKNWRRRLHEGMCPLSWWWWWWWWGGLGNAVAAPPSSPLLCRSWDSFQKRLILTRQLCSGQGMSRWMHQIEIWQLKMAVVGSADYVAKKWEEKDKKSPCNLQSYRLGGPAEHRGGYSGWSKTAPTGERGRIEDFHLITHKHSLLPSSAATQGLLTNDTSFCVCGGHNREQACLSPSVRLPSGIIQGTPSTSRERRSRDNARGVKGKSVEQIQGRYCQEGEG